MVTSGLGLSFAGGWHIEFVDTPDSSYYYYTSIALDSDDNPHISYYDSYPNYELKYAFWNGSAWDITTVDNEEEVGAHSSMALDSLDNPHISYQEWIWEDIEEWDTNLKYAFWDGSTWNISWVDTEECSGSYTSIAIDSEDKPHISYEQYMWVKIGGILEKYDNKLKYAYWDGSSWNISVVDQVDDSGSFTSIAIDSYDNPHISYRRDHDCLMYAFWDGFAWYITSVDDTTSMSLRETSIALDSSDNPHISYYPYNYHCLKYAFWDGISWNISIVDDDGNVGRHNSIALDSEDHPHISYLGVIFEKIGGFWDLVDIDPNLKYAYWDGSSWNISVVDQEGDVGSHTSIALDSDDNPHISYRDSTWPTDTSSLKYAWYDPYTKIKLITFSAVPKGDSTLVINWTVETTEGENIIGFNLYRREMNNNIAAEVSNLGCIWTKVNNGLITGQNPYTYTDSDVEANVAYEYKLEAVLSDESAETLGTTQATAGQPTSFAILALYPNPASEQVTVFLSLPNTEIVELAIYDIAGRLIMRHSSGELQAGEKSVILNTRELASGVYTLSASSPSGEDNARMVIIR